MPFNGSGVFTLPAGNPVVTGTVISSTVQNNTMADVANNGLSNCITKDGQSTPTANIGFGGFRVQDVANAIVATEVAPVGQIQNGAIFLLGAVAGTDTITGTVTPPIAAYAAGQVFRFIAVGANTTSSPTLNIGSVGAKAITKNGTQSLAPGDISSGGVIEVVYDGTQFQVIGGLARSGSFPPRFRDLTKGETSLPTTTSVTLSPGEWRSYNDECDIVLTTAITKVLQASGAWAAGSGGNGLFSGSRTAGTAYYMFVIRKDSDGSLDAGFDTSIIAANRPAGYTAFRRVRLVPFLSGAVIPPCVQAGDEFNYTPRLQVLTNTGIANATPTSVSLGLTVPNGVRSEVQLSATISGAPSITALNLEGGTTASAPAAGTQDLTGQTVSGGNCVLTDTSAHVVLYASPAIGNGLYLNVVRYRDFLED